MGGCVWLGSLCLSLTAAADPPTPLDPGQILERTCFQTAGAYDDGVNLRSDVAIVYGIDRGLPDRIESWRNRGYRIHVMTGVSWGNYQDYLYGRFDGVNHEDEAQTDREGKKISHGGDVYYMCPGENFGRFLSVGVQRALDAEAEAIHLEEPEFWVRGGYSEGFRREWKKFYGEEWIPPHRSVDAQWRASRLKYYLYRRALQQVFDSIQDHNKKHSRTVRCYVPTHSLINYAHWRIVSPESSLARLDGCDGYIAQVWTGTSRTPNLYRGSLRERTFETAFLEYGAMQNLVRSTGRTVWFLNDPIEDNPNHDWEDYRRNWESTLVASLLQPDVWRYEVMPWPQRIFFGKYPAPANTAQRIPIPAPYATEIQTVIHALNDLRQPEFAWDGALGGVGILISDSLMFQRGDPAPSDPHLSHFYGLALPLLKRGIPIEPVQLENAALPGYLDRQRLLLLTYEGMKPLSPDVHPPLAAWVRSGGVLVVWDDDADPYHRVREWWNTGSRQLATPRHHLFELLGLSAETAPGRYPVGRGAVLFRSDSPSALARQGSGDATLISALEEATRGSNIAWRESNHLILRRGPYVIAAGLDESIEAPPRALSGQFVNLFDPELELQTSIPVRPGSRWFLLDLDRSKGGHAQVLAAACKVFPPSVDSRTLRASIEGIANTEAILLIRLPAQPQSIRLDGKPVAPFRADPARGLLWLRFANQAQPRELRVEW